MHNSVAAYRVLYIIRQETRIQDRSNQIFPPDLPNSKSLRMKIDSNLERVFFHISTTRALLIIPDILPFLVD
jgi:hypothetical protein